jgi:hypothetical protein
MGSAMTHAISPLDADKRGDPAEQDSSNGLE